MFASAGSEEFGFFEHETLEWVEMKIKGFIKFLGKI